MGIYQELGLKTIINASDTYTKIGGSRMSEGVLAAMAEAARSFVDIGALARKIGAEIASMTGNEAAFVSSGCGACVVLATAALMTGGDEEPGRRLPDTSLCARDEFVVFGSQTTNPSLPYWRLIELSGAKVVRAEPTVTGLKAAISERCAGVWYFVGCLYEQGLPPVEQVIGAAHEMGVPVLVDVAAQLPPAANLWHYTKELGADGAVFSGGKFLMGPQSTGLFVGRAEIAEACYGLANPNMGIGRPYKVGKEEYVALYAAVKEFLQADAQTVLDTQNRHLDAVLAGLAGCGLETQRLPQGRLGQPAPRLLIRLPHGKTGDDCAAFLYHKCDPAIDIGFSAPDDPAGDAREVFINSINLRSREEDEHIAASLRRYLGV